MAQGSVVARRVNLPRGHGLYDLTVQDLRVATAPVPPIKPYTAKYGAAGRRGDCRGAVVPPSIATETERSVGGIEDRILWCARRGLEMSSRRE